MYGILLYWITALLLRRKNLNLNSEIKITHKKLLISFKYFRIKPVIKNNFDIKPAILKLFFFSYLFNATLVAFSVAANFLYTSFFFYNFFDVKISDIESSNWHWEIGVPIINILFIFFVLRMTSAYYKLSLRARNRNNYSKILFLDIVMLNFFDVIGILIFKKNKNLMLKINDDLLINNSNLNYQTMKDYFKLIFKIEIIIMSTIILLFLAAVIAGYFVAINGVKVICLAIIVIDMALLYGWSIPRMIGLIVAQRMFKSLINSNNYYQLLGAFRYLVYVAGYYYPAVLINFLKFDENSKEFIINNW